ncbi:MAG: alpha/beta hydrolase [Wenzhouxiangellaceae bacterium]|nr:alpha/beta hydrolase [Wenzhouxiangellaceae bacterium]
MLVITNRKFRKHRNRDTYSLKDAFNPRGPEELRLFWATPRTGDEVEKWDLRLVPDRPRLKEFSGLDTSFIPAGQGRRFGSDLATAKLLARIAENKRDVLLFIHGYNTNVHDALARAHRIETSYPVEVVVFSWPSNGGGDNPLEDAHGVASYLLDKADARKSIAALDRALWRMHALITGLNAGLFDTARTHARQIAPDDRDEQRREIARWLREHRCPFNVTLLAHSMGNYLYKKLLTSSSERLSCDCTFDNVVLKAADTNHEDHADWVARIRARQRVYILINQNDHALKLSSLKVGEAQKARLGATLAEQNAANASYIDLTEALGDEHSYFDRTDLETPFPELEPLMEKLVTGRNAHAGLGYRVDTNTFVPQ